MAYGTAAGKAAGVGAMAQGAADIHNDLEQGTGYNKVVQADAFSHRADLKGDDMRYGFANQGIDSATEMAKR